MTDTMYRFDFRRMTVEDVEDPKPPPGIGIGIVQAPPQQDNASITFSVMGTPPMQDVDED
jgi:hypothetical protein